jgi:hypothetical protein
MLTPFLSLVYVLPSALNKTILTRADLENNGGGLNRLEPIHPAIFTFILYGHGEFIFSDILSSH